MIQSDKDKRMIRHTQAAFVLAFVASSAVIAYKADAQERLPQSFQRENAPEPDEPSRGALSAKAALKLTAEQEQLWNPVEAAVRNLQERTRVLRSRRSDGPNDQMDQLRRMADSLAARGDALKTLADAVQPLWTTLSDEQKRLLPRFIGAAAGQNAGQNDEDRTSSRGRDARDDPDMGRRHDGRGDHRPMMRRGDDSDQAMGRRHGGDGRDEHRRMARRGDDTGQSGMDRSEGSDDQRGERFGPSSRGWQQDARPQPRDFARDRSDFDRRADRDRCDDDRD